MPAQRTEFYTVDGVTDTIRGWADRLAISREMLRRWVVKHGPTPAIHAAMERTVVDATRPRHPQIGVSPCEAYFCDHYRQCKVEHMACAAFTDYVQGRVWRNERIPSRAYYRRVFHG